jgi:hypothetical protein
MAWKILTIVGYIALITAGVFSWFNKVELDDQRYLVTVDKKNKKLAEDRLKEVVEMKGKQDTVLAELLNRLATKKEEVATLESTKMLKEQEVTTTKSLLDDVSGQLSVLENKLREYGDIKKLLAEVKNLQTDLETATADVNSKRDELASDKSRVTSLTNTSQDFAKLEDQQKRGVVTPQFQAYVKTSYPQWGFVILNKGDAGGVYLNSILDVRRGGALVGRIKVNQVESDSSAASVVSGSMPPGEFLRQGDLIVAGEDARRVAASEKAGPGAAVPGAPAAPGGPEPALPQPGAPAPGAPADPFGTGGAPMTPADPFGAPAAPAPADPFGAPAPAPPAPGATDPFGGAPATPAPGTPAPADPFGDAATPAVETMQPAAPGTPAPDPFN